MVQGTRWNLVAVSEHERQSLDEGKQALKHTMPSGWDPEAGYLFTRLRRFDITFNMHSTAGPAWHCSCGHAPGKSSAADRLTQA